MNPRLIRCSIVAGVVMLVHLRMHVEAAGTSSVFATDVVASTSTNPAAANAAAIVDGHVISMEDVTLECLRKYRSPIVDQMLQNYILDRECGKRGITVDE